MIKNNKGVTIIVLVVVIVLLCVLAGVSLNLANSTINDVKNSKFETELGMVSQAVSEQYSKAVAVGEIEKTTSEDTVDFWVGTRIMNFSEIALPNQNSIILSEEAENFYQKADNYQPVYQEDYYYRLTPSDLTKIGISDSDANYVVNYSSGEVYNETQKQNSKSQLLYLSATEKQVNTLEKDETFNDWKE